MLLFVELLERKASFPCKSITQAMVTWKEADKCLANLIARYRAILKEDHSDKSPRLVEVMGADMTLRFELAKSDGELIRHNQPPIFSHVPIACTTYSCITYSCIPPPFYSTTSQVPPLALGPTTRWTRWNRE